MSAPKNPHPQREHPQNHPKWGKYFDELGAYRPPPTEYELSYAVVALVKQLYSLYRHKAWLKYKEKGRLEMRLENPIETTRREMVRALFAQVEFEANMDFEEARGQRETGKPKAEKHED